MSTTFVVDPKIERSRSGLSTWGTVPEALGRLTGGAVPEAWGANLPNLLPAYSNAFVHALTSAYADHFPLVLAPDDVWMVLAQSFAKHVDLNAESLRREFVAHDGKVKIVWRNDFLVMGSPDNPWMDGFGFFAGEIRKHVGKRHDLLTANFTTSGPVEVAASQVVLMDAMKHYFSYGVQTCCGIPEITLLGTAADWRSVRDRVRAFSEFEGLSAWSQRLDPLLAEFVNASEGRVDQAFWREIYKSDHMGSGGPVISGWANAFFLYLQGPKSSPLNPVAVDAASRRYPQSHHYPSGVSAVPFVWDYHGSDFEYEFLGGFMAVSQDPETLAVRPSLGWAVRPRAGG